MWLFGILLTIHLFFSQSVLATYDPTSVENNKYGIHIADINDLSDIPQLVNSSGGDWGYVTFVITENEMDKNRWQDVFNKMRRLHLIPIVRIATNVKGDKWEIPKQDSIDRWVEFLSSLNWPIQNRYIILYNEPNHAKEWGGTIDPVGYANIVREFTQKLKNSSNEYFILPAGLDVSAGNTSETVDAVSFLQQVIKAQPNFFDHIDGWSSHSYPNPNFSSSPYKYGRGTLRSYQWEIQTLQSLGITKKLPVFVTETGWLHREGKIVDNSLLSPSTVSDYITDASTDVWNDPQIVAITPFIYNYQDYPFDHFSWKIINSNQFYAHYTAYQLIKKNAGKPKQIHAYQLTPSLIPTTLVSSSSYTFSSTLKNVGQAIIGSNLGDSISFNPSFPNFTFLPESVPYIEPGEQGNIVVHVKTPLKVGSYDLSMSVNHNSITHTIHQFSIRIVDPPSASFHVQLAWKKESTAKDATVIIYSLDNQVIHKFTNVTLEKGVITVNRLTDIVPNTVYRIVVLIPYYLPRQVFASLSATSTSVQFPRFIPADFDKNGTFSLGDFIALIKLSPKTVLNLITN